MPARMIKILIAPNSYKECAYSTHASQVIADAFKKHLHHEKKEFELTRFPVSDGGDGFLDVIKMHFSTVTKYFKIKSLSGGGYFECPVEYCKEKNTVYLESAKVIGLKLVPAEERRPLEYNSAPMGELLDKINCAGFPVDQVVIGIGGTATNDLGAGILSRFGMKLYDSGGKELSPIPENFSLTASADAPKVKLNYSTKIVTDVENKLLGDEGACRAFAGQKGAGANDIIRMEKGFENLLLRLKINEAVREKLSGAGGGIAAAFQLFFSAQVITAQEFITGILGLKSINKDFDLVITGEGALDSQTLLNKGAMIIYNFFKDLKRPVCFICGENKLDKIPELLEIFELKKYFNSSDESIKRFPEAVDLACREISRKYFFTKT
jgi:glycerate kinase